ncbi:hypothetical protein [Bradyrhizobium sp. LHD-71]|uniref:DUF6894 family protein n=1 Tax=Bradyrhizobium sp. LHD-71 TaxID=3072141 RepID=UPI0035BE950D
MPRYFFNVYNGTERHVDDVGEVLLGCREAWHEATISAGQSLRGLDGKLLLGSDWCMEVLDESGHKLYSLHVSATVHE